MDGIRILARLRLAFTADGRGGDGGGYDQPANKSLIG